MAYCAMCRHMPYETTLKLFRRQDLYCILQIHQADS